MKCTNDIGRILTALISAVLIISAAGCSGAVELEDAFQADRPGLGVSGSNESGSISYFAEDLCVVDENVEAIEADTSEALAA